MGCFMLAVIGVLGVLVLGMLWVSLVAIISVTDSLELVLRVVVRVSRLFCVWAVVDDRSLVPVDVCILVMSLNLVVRSFVMSLSFVVRSFVLGKRCKVGSVMMGGFMVSSKNSFVMRSSNMGSLVVRNLVMRSFMLGKRSKMGSIMMGGFVMSLSLVMRCFMLRK